MPDRYFGNWSDHEGMVSDFSRYNYGENRSSPPEDMATDAEVLFASYSTPSYEGDATVLFERDGKLYEVNGSHCSCNGLEDQWSPDEVTWEALAMRVPGMKENDAGGYGYGFLHDHEPETREAFRALVASHQPPAGPSTPRLTVADLSAEERAARLVMGNLHDRSGVLDGVDADTLAEMEAAIAAIIARALRPLPIEDEPTPQEGA